MSAHQFSTFASALDIPVVDRHGHPAGLDRQGQPLARTLANSPLSYLYPEEPVVLINWLWEQQSDYRLQPGELSTPVQHAGKTYFGRWAWGSAVKRGVTIGLTRDLLRATGLGRKAEDGQRVGRWLLANCQYGAATGKLRVKYVPARHTFNGLPLEDGFAYITQSLARTIDGSRLPRRLAEPEDANDSYQFWQRIPWTDEIQAESLPHLQDALDQVATRAISFHVSTGMADKRRYAELDRGMLLHPYVANALARSEKAGAMRLATSIPTASKVRMAVPTTGKGVAAHGKVILTRYPIASWGNVSAHTGNGDRAEIDRIARMETAQYTLATRDSLFDKGFCGIVPDERLAGYDLVICADNAKMASEAVRAAIQNGGDVVLEDAFIGFVMHYVASVGLGIEAGLWKGKAGDFDGDPAILTDCAERPVLWDAVAAFPQVATRKLDKTESGFEQGDLRPEMICRSMRNLIGLITNVQARTFCITDRELLASQLGYRRGAEEMDEEMAWESQAATDLFKVAVDADWLEKKIAVQQSNLDRLLGRGAPWARWKRDDWAFVHGVPMPYDPAFGTDKHDPRVRTSIPPHFDGTVAQIARLALPQLEGAINTPIEARPLAEFRRWAVRQTDSVQKQAGELQVAFNNRVGSVNFTDPEDVQSFRTWWDLRVQDWLKDSGLEPMMAAQALWVVAHSSSSTYAGAASVFYAFPDECELIVSTKPGLQQQSSAGFKTVALGLKVGVEQATCPAKVIEYEEVRQNKRLVRKAIVPADAGLTEGDYCAIPMDVDAPDLGEYTAQFTRRSARSWWVTLS